MGRRKIEIKAIKDDRNRSVTFLKRKGGLFKKAHELSVLCSVDVAVIIFGHNKKLYEFSSGNVNEIIERYHYYGTAHEHKGPSDFNGRKDMDDDDDEEMASPPPGSHSSQEHHVLPQQLQDQPNYQHMRQHTASASPPISNGVPFHHPHPHPHGTPPQPQNISRPSSRTAGRRSSSNLVPQQVPHGSQPPPSQNGYSYAPVYNQQAGAGMPLQPGHPQPPQHPAGPYHQYPAQAGHPPPQQASYMQDQRRQSMPPAFPQDRPVPAEAPSPPPPQRSSPQQNLAEPQHAKAKYRSIFTPVDESRSLLAQHWGMGAVGDSQVNKEPPNQTEGHSRPRSRDSNSGPRSTPPKPLPTPRVAVPQRTASMPSLPDTSDLQLNNAGQAVKRPKLTVHIPEEASEDGAPTGGSSPQVSGDPGGSAPSGRGGTEGSHSSGVVLPPPSPSASALLSAGAQGPPNPFARPNPPSSAGPSNNNMETPISALPSRFMADGLLPSPSSFYPEWGFGRNGGESNMLPSPLNFQTPITGNGSSFLREEADQAKRKTPDGDNADAGPAKKVKT